MCVCGVGEGWEGEEYVDEVKLGVYAVWWWCVCVCVCVCVCTRACACVCAVIFCIVDAQIKRC